MIGNQKDDYISTASNEKLFQETTKRLKQLYFQTTGFFFENASFEFVFKDGRFSGLNITEKELLYKGSLWPRLV